MKNTTLNTIWAAGIAVLLGICNCNAFDKNTAAEGVRGGCVESADCDAGQLCVFRRCAAGCEHDQDCANGAICLWIGRGGACTRVQDNVCADNTECPGTMKCVGGRCLNQCDEESATGCPSGSSCVGGVCQANARQSDSNDAGGASSDLNHTDGYLEDSGQSTPDDGKTEEACPPNSAQCRGDQLVNCDAQGREQPEQACAFVCRDGQCMGVCKPEERRCDGKVLQNCDGAGQWKTLETCTEVCTPNGCVTHCDDGVRQCNGPTLMTCKSNQMVQEQKCPYVCRNNACAGACVPGTGQCLLAGGLSCDAEGQWGNWIACRNACTNGVCSDCTAGDKRCGGDSAYQVCNDKGQWGDSITCSNQACRRGLCIGDCTPGTAKCEEGAMSTCGSYGAWGPGTACVTGSCVDNRCKVECGPSDIRCKPESNVQLQSCSAQGAWQDGETCENQACVNGQCEGECTPGNKACASSSAFQTCGNNGRWTLTPCAANQVCTNADCVDTVVCSSGNSPDWYAGQGSDLNDPRWGSATGTAFASARTNRSGNYRILLDRAPGGLAGPQGELVVSIRATSSANDTANTSDYVYFGVGNADGNYARAITIALIGPTTATINDPKTLSPSTFEQHEFKGSGSSAAWSHTKSNSVGWITSPAAWIDRSSGASWAVNLRVNLQAAGIADSQKPFRAAVGMHVAREPSIRVTELTTPNQSLEALTTTTAPSDWPLVTAPTGLCIANVTLAP